MITITSILDCVQEALTKRDRENDQRAARDFWIPEFLAAAQWLGCLVGENGDNVQGGITKKEEPCG